MRTYDLIFDGTNPIRLSIDHKFFLLLSDGGFPVDISMRKNGGFYEMKGLQAGFGLKLTNDQRGKEFIFACSNAQTVKVFVGDDEAIYNRLSGTVTVNGGSLASITNPVKITDDGSVYGNSFKSNTGNAANTAEVVFSAASNLNGAVIHDARFCGYKAVVGYTTLVAKATSPANILDGDVILSGDIFSTGSNTAESGKLIKPIFIQAGKGLYFISSSTETSIMKSVLYTLK